MSSNSELLAKIDGALGQITKGATEVSDGMMNPEQAKQFIQNVVDQSRILKLIGVEQMTRAKKEINIIKLANRILSKGVKSVAPDVTAWSYGKRELDVVETVLAVNISFDDIEDGIEAGNLESTITNMIGVAFGNDLADLLFNGDTASNDPFLSINDGIKKLIVGDNDVATDAFTADDKIRAVFSRMRKAMPNKWKVDPTQLVYFCSPDIVEQYQDELADKYTVLGDKQTSENYISPFKGSKIEPIGTMDDNLIILTNPNNLKIGIDKRYMRLGRFVNERTRSVELTMTTKSDVNYALGEALVVFSK